MARLNGNKGRRTVALAALLLAAAVTFAATVTDTYVLRLRGVVLPQASFQADGDGNLSVMANHNDFSIDVLDQMGRPVAVKDGKVITFTGQKLTLSVQAS
ncbi:MAG: hypothetical protein ACOX6K_10055 [Sphaerochaetaceae bacterium]|jgi:fermentation-respiration switch protein FrsA (DUF1100 family)